MRQFLFRAFDGQKYRGGPRDVARPASAQIVEAFIPNGDESGRIQGNRRHIRLNEAGLARKRWLIGQKERTVRPCPIMRDSSCCKFMQAADHDHALAA
jgi:hypothetical protein